MKLAALCPVRNEDWIIGLSLRAALRWCDCAIVLLHACTDKSAGIVSEVAAENQGRITILEDSGSKWAEMDHRQQLLEGARMMGATHCVITDADEILSGNLLGSIRRLILDAPRHHITQLPGYNLRGGVDRYHSSGVWGNRWFSVAFADHPGLHWKGDRFHHREPMGAPPFFHQPVRQHQGGVMHLWGASERRLIARHRLYKISERLRWPHKPVAEIDRLYNLAIHGQPGDRPDSWRYMTVPDEWWAPYTHLAKYLNLDAEPWQESECERLVAEHGREKFAGLDLFEEKAVLA